jgi:hypothetical protein
MGDINPKEVLNTMEPVVEVLSTIGATEWWEWLNDAYKRASGSKGPAIEWIDLLWFARLNYLPILRFAQEHEVPKDRIEKLNECFEQFLLALNPGWPAEVCGFIKLGDREDETRVFGPLAPAELIAADSLRFAHVFCATVASGKIRESYELLSEEFRANRSLRAYMNIFDRAAAKYNGYPQAFALKELPVIYTGPNSFGRFCPKWPKYVNSDHKRALVHVFWQTIASEDFGCFGALWLTGKNGAYALSKIEFWTP